MATMLSSQAFNLIRFSGFSSPSPSSSSSSSSSSSQRLLCRPRYSSISFNSNRATHSLKPPRKPVRICITANASSVSSAVSEDISNVLGDVSIFTAAGEPVKFKDLWDQNEGIAVVALLRHFGCPCCWELASALNGVKETFDSAGVKLIAVGVGAPNKARILAERLPFPMDCLYADPNRKVYDVLGLYYGVGRTFFNPASAKVLQRFESLKNAVKNYTIEATPDDRSGVLQQGGMFIFKGKQLVYARKDEGTGDHAPLDDILDICYKVSVA